MAVHQQPATPFTLGTHLSEPTGAHASAYGTCLLYTSDAADAGLGVDLGGGR